MSMLTPEQYLDRLRADLAPALLPAETLAPAEAVGRVLAADVAAALPVPPFTNATMDGFAVRAADLAGAGPWTVPVTGDLAAGDVAASAGPGRAVRVMTGAPLPAGADAVVRVEDTDARHDAARAPAAVTIRVPATPGMNVRRRGEDTAAGTTVMHAGERVDALTPASLAAVGVARVPVRRRPRLAVVSTGAELVGVGEAVGPARVPDSDALIVEALARAAGAEVGSAARVGDEPRDLLDALVRAAAGADLVVTTGGISMGARDVVRQVGADHGFGFATVAMRPGKPQGYGAVEVGGRRVGVLALPGNPVAVAVSFTVFGVPLLRDMFGEEAPQPCWALAGTGWRSPAGRREYLPGALRLTASGATVTPIHPLGSASHLVASLHRADVLAVVPAGTDEVRPGDLLEVLPLPQ